MTRERKKRAKRLSILVVRPTGGSVKFSVPPLFLFLISLFFVVFFAISIIVINRYFILRLANDDLKMDHKIAIEELFRLRNLYSYQLMVNSDYARFVNEGPDKQSGLDKQFIPFEALPRNGNAEEAAPLDAWADLFPDPAASDDHALGIDGFEVNGGDFKFRLFNDASGKTVGGHLLLLFTALYPDGDKQITLPFPDFDFQNPEVDFETGLSFNIRLAKEISGRLELPDGAGLVNMMAVAKSNDGQIILKKKLALAD